MSAALNAMPRSADGPRVLGIGEVLSQLRPDFASLTISKIRFLESEGLLHPERTAAGYRKFSRADVDRLRYILFHQEEEFSLRRIREQLDLIDRGLAAPGSPPSSTRAMGASTVPISPAPVAAPPFRAPNPTIRLTRDELLRESGLRFEQLTELEQFGLLGKRPGGYYDEDALTIARIVAALGRYGIEGRHLRAVRSAAERDIGLFSQVVGPMARQRSVEARARAEEIIRELVALSVQLHAALVQIGLRDVLGGS